MVTHKTSVRFPFVNLIVNKRKKIYGRTKEANFGCELIVSRSRFSLLIKTEKNIREILLKGKICHNEGKTAKIP